MKVSATVFSAMTSALMDNSCQGDGRKQKTEQCGGEDLVQQRVVWDCSAFICVSVLFNDDISC
jgi:hypothetical protein